VHPEISLDLKKDRGRPISVGEMVRCLIDLSTWEETFASQILSTETTVDGKSVTALDRYWRMISASPMEKDREDITYESFQAFRNSLRGLREVLSELHMLDR
jgi:hypothetical protein